MEKKKSMFQAFLSSIIAGIIVAMIIYFALNFLGFKEYRATSKITTTSVENLDQTSSSSSFAQTINSRAIKDRTLENLKLDWPISKLDSRLEIVPMDSSAMIEFNVRDTNKLRAEDLADEYAELAVTVINNIYNTGAEVMAYSYNEAVVVDNTIKYAAVGGAAGFIIYLIGSSISVKRHNTRLEEAREETYQVEEIRAKDQVEKNKEEIEENEDFYKDFYEESKEEKSQTRPIEKIEEPAEDMEKTKKIDAKDVAVARATTAFEKQSGKLEVLGKLPSYKRGDLDV